ncbi:hypothetical protein PCE1_001219 [Barthelona sp. PCE]
MKTPSPRTVAFISIISAILNIFYGLFSVLGSIVTLSPTGVAICVYLALFGVLQLGSELKVKVLRQYFLFLYHHTLKGLFCILVGTLAAILGGTGWVFFLVQVFIGLFHIFFSKQTPDTEMTIDSSAVAAKATSYMAKQSVKAATTPGPSQI